MRLNFFVVCKLHIVFSQLIVIFLIDILCYSALYTGDILSFQAIKWNICQKI